MRARERPIATVAAVLAEVVRGRPGDAGVFAGLRRERVEVYAVDTRVGVRAGQLLGSVGAGSELAVDAFVVAVADLLGGAVIASVNISDLERLARMLIFRLYLLILVQHLKGSALMLVETFPLVRLQIQHDSKCAFQFAHL
jgi:hypothetical protein